MANIELVFKSMKKWGTIIIAIAALALLIWIFFLHYANYSSGFRVGVPTKLSSKGVVFKTLEGQMNIGGMSKSGGQDLVVSEWNFSLRASSEDEVVKKIESSIAQNKRAKLFYKEKYRKLFWLGDTKYFVYAVEILEE